MRTYHIIVVAVVLVVGFGAKQFFFSPMKAKADVPSVSMNVLQMHQELNMQSLPVQKVHDKTFVFDSD